MPVGVAPSAPNWTTFFTDWQPDALLLPLLGTVALYLVAVRRLAQRGRRWPGARTLAFASGVGVIVAATESGLAAYDTTLFSVHVVQHLLLGLIAPLLLVLGAPVTLALQATSRAPCAHLLRVLHCRPVRVLTHPLTVWLLFSSALFILYFTDVYQLSLSHNWVHVLVHLHFVLVGCLFLAVAIAIDPLDHRLSYGARLLFVVVALPIHTIIGVALLSARRPIAADWYRSLGRTWGPGLLADQRIGAGLLWSVGELFGLAILAVVLHGWMRAEDRSAARYDRAHPALTPAAIEGESTLPSG